MDEVARVAVDTPLPHLDRLFDFAIPAELDEQAQPGCRVRVRFHGRRVTGWLMQRGPSEFEGKLQPLLAVLGPSVLTPEIADLCRLVADRYAGTFNDVVRFAVPSRVAAVEKRQPPAKAIAPKPTDLTGWSQYELPAVGASSWICHPHDDPFAMLAALAVDSAAAGRGAVVVVPDARDVRRLHERLTTVVDPDLVAVVSAEASARLRYKSHLDVLAGARPIVIGTRSAVFAPVVDLGLIVVWDDGDDVLVEPQAPGWHAREVAALRAWQTGARVVVGGYTRTAATAQWIADGHALDLQMSRPESRQRRYRVEALRQPDADRNRVPGRAFSLLRTGLEQGPVLVQVPRVGGATGLICRQCGHPARCGRCGGGVRLDRSGRPRCRLCHETFDSCPACGSAELIGIGAGSGLSAEQLQQAFPGVAVVRSDAESGVADAIDPVAQLVVATPGSEPVVPGGYRALLILDAEVLLSRSALRAREEAARRWMSAIARTAQDAPTLIVAPQDLPVVQALVRNDLGALASAEQQERAQAHMPPAYRCVRLRATSAALDSWLSVFDGDVLGPLETSKGSEALLLAPLSASSRLLGRVREIQAARSLAGEPVVEVRVDPVDLGDP